MIVHEHGQHGPHTHSDEDYLSHQRPIDNEVIHSADLDPSTTAKEYMTGSQWAKLLDIVIIDADGWRRDDGVHLNTLITREDFEDRLSDSSCWIRNVRDKDES